MRKSSDFQTHRRDLLIGSVALVAGVAGARARAQGLRVATDIRSEMRELAPGVYAFLQREAPGQSNFSISNAGLVVGPQSALAIDSTGGPEHARHFLAAIAHIGKPVDRVVITHEHPDHIVGLSQFPAGIDVVAQEETRRQMKKLISDSIPGYWASNPAWARPGDVFRVVVPNVTFRDRMSVYYGDIQVDFVYPGRAHTAGDALVMLPETGILFMGDIAFFGVTPLNGSGYVADWIKVCDTILADPSVKVIVPGHGPVGGKRDLADMRGYLELLLVEGRKRYDAGISAGRAAAEIPLGHYASWSDPDRVANNMARLYSEWRGTLDVNADQAAVKDAIRDYSAAKRTH